MVVKPYELYTDVLMKAAEIMKRNPTTVSLGYEAPWCEKKGTKYELRYLSDDADLDEMGLRVKEFLSSQKQQKRKSNISYSIILRNVNDEVSFLPI